MNDNLNNVTILPPFKRFCMTIGELPTSYLESMTYYESLVWLCNYLSKTVIPAINANGEAVIELQEKYIELKDYVDNYFENLDIQTEINNKLDEMAESGELAEIIAAYLEVKSVLGFDTKADLKSADNLINGSICRTLGTTSYNDGFGHYYRIRTLEESDVIDDEKLLALSEYPTLCAELIDENIEIIYDTLLDLKADSTLYDGKQVITLGYNSVNDGGNGVYLVRNKTGADNIDEGSIVEISNTLVAELICTDVKLEQFGATGDGTTDDTDAISYAITYAKATNKKLTCGSGKVFAVSSQLDISNLFVDFNNSTFKAIDEINSIFVVNTNNKNYNVENVIIDCNSQATTGFLITNARTFYLNNLTFKNVLTYGIKVDNGYEIIVNHIFMTTTNNGSTGIELNTSDCNINDVIMTDLQTAFRLTKGSNTFNNIHCWIGTSSKINDSYMFKLALVADGTVHLSNIYNDTYRYGFYYENSANGYLYVDNFETQYNTTIYTSDKESSYILYANTINQTTYSYFSNAFIKGLGSNSELQHTEMTNLSYYYGFINHSDLNDMITKLDFELTNIDSRFTPISNYIIKSDGVITINFLASYDASSVSGMINPVAKIPWWFLPSENILSYCQITDSRWDYTNDSQFAYMFIDKPNEKIQVKIPSGGSGTKYLHINLTYVNRKDK